MAIEGLNQREVSDFQMDLAEALRISKWLKRKHFNADKTYDEYLPKFKLFLNSFNKKYNDIHLEMINEPYQAGFRLGIFIKSESVKHVFSDGASKIKGISAIGTESFDEANVSDSALFSEKIKVIQHMVYLSYMDAVKGSDSFLILDDKKRGMVEVICPPEEFLSGHAFELCALYALKAANWKIDVYSKASEFGFVDELIDQEKRDWDKKFPAYFGE